MLNPVAIAAAFGLLALGVGVWRRSWAWWVWGYLFIVVAVVAALVT